jgi:cysteine sulfinate desulfinase/cysteine desulfurase-like protein
MGTSQSIAESSIRLSLGLLNTQADVDKIVDCIAEAYNQLKHFVRR